ncbi:hypothetical protein BT63DRAFT_466811 [Microthyrium microscopicum]|uniref:NACHT domain-containing protein n=1 Tax=Microthyrium microscopicum TaxID=703497 RepID=A0A6A6UPA4_9PEZI|nr:hypothetical protein BT63DRAFT_466811 [Microthyrium microscopicum]
MVLDPNHSTSYRLLTIDSALSLAIKANLDDVSRKVVGTDQAVQVLQSHVSKQERDEILSWLSPLVYGSKQSDIVQRYQEGTGKWLFEASQYLKWISGSGKILWCPGMPGAGKTTLASHIISEFQRNLAAHPEVELAYAFCSYNAQDQTATNLLAGLLRQLLHNRDSLPTCVTSLYESHRNKGIGTRPNLSEISQCLVEIFGLFSRVIIIVDALDEYDEGDGVRDVLGRELLKLSSIHNAHVLVTSRWITSIENLFEGCLRLEIRATDQDIARYLETRMEGSSRLQRIIKEDPQIKESIVTTIVERCEGMFLLAQLHMDSLQTKANVKAIGNALQTIPRKLDDTYDLVMDRIESQNEDDVLLARQMLAWLTYSIGTMTVVELQHALAVHFNGKEFDQALIDKETMLSICAGIVTVEEESNKIRFIHYTTQEYFRRIRKTIFPQAEHDICKVCMTYLHRDEVAKIDSKDIEIFKLRMRSHPLLEYAASYWGLHARGEVATSLETSIISFLKDDSAVQTATRMMFYDRTRSDAKRTTRGIHIAAYFGLEHIVSRLIEDGIDVDRKDMHGQTPLHFVASKTPSPVQQLVLLEDDPIAKDTRGWSALHRAAFHGQEEAVEVLVEAGLDIDSTDIHGNTALHIATRRGKISVIEKLAKHQANMNPKNQHGESPLHYAALPRGNTTDFSFVPIAELLLKLGADVNSADNKGRTPLYWVCLPEDSDNEATEFLLSKGAKLNIDANNVTLLKWSNVAQSLPDEAIWQSHDISPVDAHNWIPSDLTSWNIQGKARLMSSALDGYWILEQGVDLDEDDNCDFSHSSIMGDVYRKIEVAIELDDTW